MRDVSKETISQAFMAYCGPDTPPRLRTVLESFVRHLHGFAIETGLTHAEWRKALELLMAAGKISTPERNEFVLFSDVLGLSSLVDMVNSPSGATPSSVLGPFHILGAPALPYGGDLKRDNAGKTLVVTGKVVDSEGNPVTDGVIEIWQTADNGLYSNQDPAQPEYNLRGRTKTSSDGRYLFSTVRPQPYTVPDDGPVGELLKATGRHPWRPSHLHFIVQAPGCSTLVTELFPIDDPYLDQDAVFGVRKELILNYREVTDRSTLPTELAIRDRIDIPFLYVEFDIVLKKA